MSRTWAGEVNLSVGWRRGGWQQWQSTPVGPRLVFAAEHPRKGQQPMPHANEEGVATRPIAPDDQHRSRAAHLRTAIRRTNLVPAFLVLTIMMVALWLMGMPFLQALTISTAVKISVALLELRRLPDPVDG
ncbi:hypothetical protein [Streptomyces virginiae]|uniref:hypothetical protein n=2 Tax=Streptomyces virginiae TaxID=1961 RepID=UPI00131B5D29|nr:hypothetical protein [Streptomyces virginiae]